MLHEKHMPKYYWAEAASTTVYFVNRCTTNGVHALTPYETYLGRKSILSHLKVWKHCVCTHSKRKMSEVWLKLKEMHPCMILVWAKGIQVLRPSNSNGSRKSGHSLWRIGIMVWGGFGTIRTDQGRVGCQFGWLYSSKSYTKWRSKLYQLEWTTRASKQRKHISIMGRIRQRERKDVWIWSRLSTSTTPMKVIWMCCLTH